MTRMEAEDKRPSHRVFNWGMWVVVALLLYVLSVGPVFCIILNYPSLNSSPAGSTLNIIYAPLNWVTSQNETADKAMQEYVIWWLKITDTRLYSFL